MHRKKAPSWELVIFGFLITCIILLGMLCRVIIQRLREPFARRK